MPRYRVEMLEMFEKHLDNLNLSRRDDFIVESIKISYFSGFADAMNNLTENWFNEKAEKCGVILSEALAKLQEMQKQAAGDEFQIDLSEPAPVSMDYTGLKLDND